MLRKMPTKSEIGMKYILNVTEMYILIPYNGNSFFDMNPLFSPIWNSSFCYKAFTLLIPHNILRKKVESKKYGGVSI